MNLILINKNDFISGKTVRLSLRQSEHVRNVHRAEKGQVLRVGVLNGKMGTGLVSRLDNDFVELELELNDDPPVPLELTLVLALPRPKVLKRTIQSAIALGIKEIYLINTWKVDKSYWKSPVLSKESLDEQIILGLEQAVDTIPPNIYLRKLFKPFVEDELPEIATGKLPLIAHPSSKQPIIESLKGEIVLAIGPEGGFIPYEVERFEGMGFQSVKLGDRILKVEQALPALVAKLTL